MMHYAVSHQTAAEIIYDRADVEKPHMGLMTWKNAPEEEPTMAAEEQQDWNIEKWKEWNIERLKAFAGNLQEPLLYHL